MIKLFEKFESWHNKLSEPHRFGVAILMILPIIVFFGLGVTFINTPLFVAGLLWFCLILASKKKSFINLIRSKHPMDIIFKYIGIIIILSTIALYILLYYVNQLQGV